MQFINISDEWKKEKFMCDFCFSAFQTEDARNTHILEHFEEKNCSKCNKHLLRIGSKWYELHVDEVDSHIDGAEASIAEIKVEAFGEPELFGDFYDLACMQDSSPQFNDEQKPISSEATEIKPEDCDESSPEPVSKRKKSTQKSESNKNETKSSTQKNANKLKRGNRRTKTDVNEDQQIEITAVLPASQSRRKGRMLRIKCRICERMIIKRNFEMHLQKMHVPRVIVREERIRCETCGKSFATVGNLKTHSNIHSGIKRFGNIFHFYLFCFLFYILNFSKFHSPFTRFVLNSSMQLLRNEFSPTVSLD